MPRSAEMPLTATSSLSVICAGDHHVVLVLGEQRDRHQPKAALDRDKDGRGLAAPDQRAVGNFPGDSHRVKEN